MKPQWEELICSAIDMLADNREKEAMELLQNCMELVKNNIQEKRDLADSYYTWGMCLSVMEEYEQAVLKFEQAVTHNKDHEASLWQIVSILFYNLEKASEAKSILEEKLMIIDSKNERYQEMLQDVTVYLKRHTAK